MPEKERAERSPSRAFLQRRARGIARPYLSMASPTSVLFNVVARDRAFSPGDLRLGGSPPPPCTGLKLHAIDLSRLRSALISPRDFRGRRRAFFAGTMISRHKLELISATRFLEGGRARRDRRSTGYRLKLSRPTNDRHSGMKESLWRLKSTCFYASWFITRISCRYSGDVCPIWTGKEREGGGGEKGDYENIVCKSLLDRIVVADFHAPRFRSLLEYIYIYII